MGFRIAGLRAYMTIMTQPEHSPAAHCATLARTHDRDRFLCAQFAPAAARDDLYALLAFNLELVRGAETASEPILGQMRVQWWRDAMDDIFAGRPPGHPVAQALSVAAVRQSLPRADVDRLMAARFGDVGAAAPPDLDGLVGFIDDTAGALMHLHAAVIAPGTDKRALAAVARAWGLVGLLRSVPYHAAAGRRYLPEAVCRAHGLSERALFAGKGGAALRAVMADMADAVDRQLKIARDCTPRPAKGEMALYLPAVLAAGYLSRLRRHGFQPVATAHTGPTPGQMLRMAFAAWRRTY